jgi:hypothetical protein
MLTALLDVYGFSHTSLLAGARPSAVDCGLFSQGREALCLLLNLFR